MEKLDWIKKLYSFIKIAIWYYWSERIGRRKKKSRLEEFNTAFTDCVNAFDNNKPFYPKEVYDEIYKTIRLARREVREYNRGEKYSKEYWENAEKNIEEIINSTNIVCEKIRQRIGIIKIEN